jgi:HK97 gp10 family phage protein
MSNKHRSRNLGLLARRFAPFREKAVTAIEFGQNILAAGLAIRAPRRTGKLVRSIRKTKVKNDNARHRLVGRVIVTSPYALYVEYRTRRTRAQPFVRPTAEIDGPLAVRAMIQILKS